MAHLKGIAPFVLRILLPNGIRGLRFRFRRAIHVWIVADWQLTAHRAIFGLADLTILRL